MTFYLLLLNHVILPLIVIIFFYQREVLSRTNFILDIIFVGSYITLIMVIGPQAWTSIFVGYLIIALFVFVLVINWMKLPESWSFKLGNNWRQISFTIIRIILIVIFLPLALWGISGYSFDEEEVINLEFPFKDGLYIVGHGGSNPLINYHNVSETQTYAVDISKLNWLGSRAMGAYPTELDKYAIFGENLYSPCDGTVTKVIKNQPDFNPPETGEGHPAGNHVEMVCDGVTVILAHMKQNTVTVDSGQVLSTRELLGQIGNSGNTSEPHLHIHAEKDGEGIPIVFDERFVVRNSVVWK